MELDPEVDTAYPARWIGKVSVATRDGRTLVARVDEPKGDPGNTLTRGELTTRRSGSRATAVPPAWTRCRRWRRGYGRSPTFQS